MPPILPNGSQSAALKRLGVPHTKLTVLLEQALETFQRDEGPTTTMQFTGNAKLSFTLPIRISHGNFKPSTYPWLRGAFYFRLRIHLHFQWDVLSQSDNGSGGRSSFVLNVVNIG